MTSSDGIPAGADASAWKVCPLDDCAVAWDITPPEVNERTLATVFGAGVMSAVALQEHNATVERTLQLHLSSHSLVEWAATVTRQQRRIEYLQEQNAELEQRLAQL